MTKVFSKYGKLCSVWVAQRPAGFAFIEYEDNEDAEGKTDNSGVDFQPINYKL